MSKYSRTSDAIANLYRAALYLARGSRESGLDFLLKAQRRLGSRLKIDADNLIQKNLLSQPQDCFYWAEKILDEYKRLK